MVKWNKSIDKYGNEYFYYPAQDNIFKKMVAENGGFCIDIYDNNNVKIKRKQAHCKEKEWNVPVLTYIKSMSEGKFRIYEKFHNCKLYAVPNNQLEVLDSMIENNMDKLILNYAEFKKTEKYNEQYKFDFALENKGIFNNLDNLADKLLNLKGINFTSYFMKNSGIKHMALNHIEELTESFKVLFDNNSDLKNRIIKFREIIKETLLKDDSWKSKGLADPNVDTAVFFLFANDYQSDLLFTQVTPYNDFAKIFNLEKLQEKNDKEQRYINWRDYCKNILVPKLNEVLKKDNSLIDAADFIWYVHTLYNEDKKQNENEVNNNESENAESENIMNEVNIPLNQILYGPPGTGKTYNTANLALKILEPDFNSDDRDEIMAKYSEYKKNKQIQFVTFHQAYSYEEFVEGIRPILDNDSSELKYQIHNGIFKNIVELAKSEYTEAQIQQNIDFEKINIYKMSLGDTLKKSESSIYEYCIENNCIALGFGENINFTNANSEDKVKEIFSKNPDLQEKTSYAISKVNMFKNILNIGDLVFISNGNTGIRAIGKIIGDYYFKDDSEIRFCQFRDVQWLYEGDEIPTDKILSKNINQKTLYKLKNDDLNFDFIKSLFMGKKSDDEIKKYVLVIDEINRGEIAKIFGELITLIEDTKRDNLDVILPYSNKSFSIPKNLYIIGTMNTADRSIALLDIALRRRFDFIAKYPNSNKIGEDGALTEVNGIDLKLFLDKMNEKIEVLLDKDHTIGHSYLMGIKNYDDFIYKFKNRILPLLQEYFYNDYDNIAKVLNQDNIEDLEWNNKEDKIILKYCGIDDRPKYQINEEFPKEAFLKVCK